MAKTTIGTSHALTKKLWEEKLFRDSLKVAYFSRFMGKGADSIVQVKTDLEKSKGDKITFGLRMRLSGAGVSDGAVLEGNEEALTLYDCSVLIHEYAHAVRDKGELDRQRPVFNMDAESRDAIKGWMAEKIDQLAFDAIVASPTKIFYGGNATATGDIGSDDKITPALISKVKAYAKTGGARTYIPLRPVSVGGKKYYVLLVHPDVMYDLKQDSTFTQAMREAEQRGKENPLFTGAAAIWDGVVIHEHENIPIVTNWGAGSDQPGAKCVFMGAQALLWAWGKRPEVRARDFDYGREHGYASIAMCGTAKPVFNSLDYGSFGVYVYRTNVAGL